MFPYKATAKYLGREKCTVHVLPKEVSLVPALWICEFQSLALAATQLVLNEYLLNCEHYAYSITS